MKNKKKVVRKRLNRRGKAIVYGLSVVACVMVVKFSTTLYVSNATPKEDKYKGAYIMDTIEDYLKDENYYGISSSKNNLSAFESKKLNDYVEVSFSEDKNDIYVNYITNSYPHELNSKNLKKTRLYKFATELLENNIDDLIVTKIARGESNEIKTDCTVENLELSAGRVQYSYTLDLDSVQ